MGSKTVRVRCILFLCGLLTSTVAVVAVGASPAQAAPFTYTAVSTGYHRACAVTTTGVGLCWGWNYSGSLGTNDRSATVYAPSIVPLPAGERFRSIEAGSYFTSCGLTESGRVYCWGESGGGWMALPAGVVVNQLSVGSSQVCALTTDARLFCTGDWLSGELGTGDQEYTHLPVQITLPDSATPAYVSAGMGFTCVVSTIGTAYCTGGNGAGQLGNGLTSSTKVFVRVALPADVRLASISGGLRRTCGLDTTGGGWCWGRNYGGAFGDGTYDNSATPRAVALDAGIRLTDIRTGWYHTCGITTAGVVLCWGENTGGALGWGQTYGGKTIRTAALPAGVSATNLTIGLSGTCITSADNRVLCWGSNLFGSGGVGTAAPVYTPTEILRVGTPDPAIPAVSSGSTHAVDITGTFVPNGAASTVVLLVAETPDFGSPRVVPVTVPRSRQAELSQVFAPVTYATRIPGLRPATTYFVKTRATNIFGAGESDATTFTTLGGPPIVATSSIAQVGGDSARVETSVDGNLLATNVEVVYSTDPKLTTDIVVTPLGSTTGSAYLSATLSALAPRTTYWARVRASNEVGTTTGEIVSFTTLGDKPTILSVTARGGRRAAGVVVGVDTGLLVANVTVAHRKHGSDAGWTIESREVGPSSNATVSFDLSNLDPATRYDVKVAVTNAVGMGERSDISFTTMGGAPVVAALQSHDIGDTTVTVRAQVDPNDFATRVTLQVDTDESFSNHDEWFAGTVAPGAQSNVSLDISDLLDSTTYYARLVAVNARGTTTGGSISFTTTTPVGKLLKRRAEPVAPVPVVVPTPPAVQPDSPVTIGETSAEVTRPESAAAVTIGVVAKTSTPPVTASRKRATTRPKPKPRQSNVSTRSTARSAR